MFLTVTSAAAGDGKSLVCANLALSFAEAGYRTLLIDGDVRRGTLHSVFNLTRTPGLLDVLQGSATIEEVLRAGSADGLSVITSGAATGAAPERLTSRALSSLFDRLRDQFDVVIVDTAPLIAGVDAFAFGVVTGSMVLVLRAAKTDRRMAQARLTMLSRIPTRLLGVVINDTRDDESYRYYHYDRGYASVEDQSPVRSGPRLRSLVRK